ncbi:hypothetical protein DFP72DRAFT_1031991 [Ephemerocybe angulata]|uniref:C2H2-type domain-containing protein n=1 Tax=Ephemerocybe angulata TaxID=980116 RepID=A0A8H6I867_9AGAR|nr:hypothetical protein DFP72DRAFT_1031991 [Tulosesus angulatus]
MPLLPNTSVHLTCPHCSKKCKGSTGLSRHVNAKHRPITPPPDDERREEHRFSYVSHPVLTGTPCDATGQELPPYGRPSTQPTTTGFEPFNSRSDFDFAHYHFVEVQTSRAQIDKAIDIWAAQLAPHGASPPWRNADDMYKTIDEIPGLGPWKTYNIKYTGPRPERNAPRWMDETYQLVTRDARTVIHEQLRTREFKDSIHYGPYMQFDRDGQRIWSNLMSADWAWSQADQIVKDRGAEEAKGAMFVPIVAGSDKTTVSVGTGHQQYYPVYLSPGNVSNEARRGHGNSVLPLGFLPIPKTSKKQRKTPAYQKFVRQLYHACLACVFRPLKAGMTSPDIVQCPDGHFRRAYYGLGPYIADYPEQVWLSCIVQNWCPKCEAPPGDLDSDGHLLRTKHVTDTRLNVFDAKKLWTEHGIRSDVTPFTAEFPRADIHELLSPDLLHQAIKGTFKDHLVTWIGEYLDLEFGKARALEIIQDIDRRISAVPSFPGLRRFPDGRDFEQWTGDDSKALMKVYIAAIAGYVPSEMVKTLSAFLDFCYTARQNSLSSEDLDNLDFALRRFHRHRQIFIDAGVRTDISLPRQHALKHYRRGIELFGSPNGLCSSITESKHIKAVKEPWRRSNRYHALLQMLQTLSRMDKLETMRRDLAAQGKMEGSTSWYTQMSMVDGWEPSAPQDDNGEENDEENELGPVSGPTVLSSIKLASRPESAYPRNLDALATHIKQPRFPDSLRRFLWLQLHPDSDLDPHEIPIADCPTFHGIIHVYHSAVARFYSPSDICGVGGWRGSYPRNDTVFVEVNPDISGIGGMMQPDAETGLWVVRPEFDAARRRVVEVIHLDSIARAAHLLPTITRSNLYGSERNIPVLWTGVS